MESGCILLASGSPRRSELLKKITTGFEVVKSGYDEPIGITASEYALNNAKCKALSAASHHKNNCVILAADTIVVLDGEVLNKPKCVSQARSMLNRLSGSTHLVITAVCFFVSNHIIADYEKSVVEFLKFSNEEIDEYIKSGSPFDKAGGYGIQDEFIRHKVRRIEGSVDNIIGLPTELIGRMAKLHQIKL